jgi:hypothetical protein
MIDLNIAPTKTTPRVAYHPESRTLEFSGESYPENSVQFYQEIQKQVETFLAGSTEPFVVSFKLDYFNTSTSKCLYDLLDFLEGAHKRNGNITVNWHYKEEDEDMQESGIDFKSEINVPFNLIACT